MICQLFGWKNMTYKQEQGYWFAVMEDKTSGKFQTSFAKERKVYIDPLEMLRQ
jgi:hypothetical protein